MAGFLQRYLTLRSADNKGAAGGFHNILRDDRQAVDFHDAFNLNEQAVKETEVAAGYASDRCNGLRISKVRFIEQQAELAPVARQNERQFIALQGPIVMGKTDAAVKLRIARKALFHTGHSDQNDTQASAVKYVADKFEPRDRQPLGFIEDEHLNVQTILPVVPSNVTVEVIVNAIIDGADMINKSFLEIAQRAHYGRRVENCTRRSKNRPVAAAGAAGTPEQK